MKPFLSIIMPAVRVNNWVRIFDSILGAWGGEFELIIISHRPLPLELQKIEQVVYIYDEGCPTRKTQLGLIATRGEYVTYFVDDGIYLPNKLNELYQETAFADPIALKYGESVDGNSHLPIMESDEYYKFHYHSVLHLPGIPSLDCKVLSFAIFPTHMLKGIGGFDCRFEHIAMAETDLSVRLENQGIKVGISREVMLHLTWEPGDAGAHAGVNHAQMDHDLPLFLDMYKDDANKGREIIDIENWKDSPAVWTRRTA